VDPHPLNPTGLAAELDALRNGRAFTDLSSWWKTSVTGSDAVAWLHDLLTADVASLRPGVSRRSLLLSPTGRIRADVYLMRRSHDVLLVQSPDQPDPIPRLLDPYVLSSDVQLEDLTNALAILAVPGSAPEHRGPRSFSPSVLGSGHDELVEAGATARELRATLVATGLLVVAAEAIEVDRVRRGVPRMGRDFDGSSLPAEAGLDALIDTTKGCFLGQESVARVRGLGHPPRVLRRLHVDHGLAVGEPVRAGGREVGQITSAASDPTEGVFAIARVRWNAADHALTLSDGYRLVDVPHVV
jgi:tRNA-modifying protein YgfZ